MRRWMTAAAIGLMTVSQAGLTSPKPCRDAQGRIVKCAKPPPLQQRCKDKQGRFVPCPPAIQPGK